jgi:hypothetical protein
VDQILRLGVTLLNHQTRIAPTTKRALSEAERQLADKEAELTKLLDERSLVAS